MANKNIGLDRPEIKNMIFAKLHSYVQNVRPAITDITDWEMVDNIRKLDYSVFSQHIGTRSWIMFFSDDNNYYSVSFPQHNIRKREHIKIYPVQVSAHKNIYNGTILEGVYYRDRSTGEQFHIVDDVYYLFGKSHDAMNRGDRLDKFRLNVKKYITQTSDTRILVNSCYPLNKSSLQELFDKIKNNYLIQDVVFCQNILRTGSYKYTIMDSDRKDDIITYAEMYLTKTDSPDVYFLLSIKTSNKIGIALIPDIASSKLCKSWFGRKKKQVRAKCIQDTDKQGWIPIELISE